MFTDFGEYPRRGFTVAALNGHCPIAESIVHFYSYILERREHAWEINENFIDWAPVKSVTLQMQDYDPSDPVPAISMDQACQHDDGNGVYVAASVQQRNQSVSHTIGFWQYAYCLDVRVNSCRNILAEQCCLVLPD
jgi:hypothetical protein